MDSPWEDINPTRSSQPTSKPVPTLLPTALHRKLILELGLRYRPVSSAQLEAHNATLSALMIDVADLPPHLLQRAIEAHVRESRFMPKASELIARAKSYVDKADDARLQQHCDELNRLGWVRASGIEWFVNRSGEKAFVDQRTRGEL